MKNVILHLMIFATVWAGQFFMTCLKYYNAYGKNASMTLHDYWYSYRISMTYHQGIALGLLVTFSIWIIRKYLAKKNIKAVRTGSIVFLVIFIALFLSLGVYESSPMFEILIRKTASFFAKMQHTTFLLTTILSTIPAYFIIRKTSKKYNQ